MATDLPTLVIGVLTALGTIRAFSDGGPIDLPMYGNFDFNLSTSNLRIKNIGAGVATDVRGIVVGPEPPEPESILQEHHSLDIAAPISAGELLDR